MLAVLPWKLWYSLYAAAFVVLITLGLSEAPRWAWWSWAALYMLFAVVTDPSPRNVRATSYSARCGCVRCMSMRARHTRRSTDVKHPKDAG